MEAIAPLDLAEPWDHVGVHIGCTGDPLTGPVLLTIDLTEPVLAEAVALGASAIVAYHPPIWKPFERLTDATPAERIARGAIRAGIAVYSPHTALDAAAGGVTDWLCEGIAGLTQAGAIGDGAGARLGGDCRALLPAARSDRHRQVKLVVFVPESHLDQVRSALATAGAGVIGAYRVCSYAGAGEGTFLPGDEASPVTGQRGRLEKVREHRLEMVCSRGALPLAVETLRQFHPYEEPAFDIYELVPEPSRSNGPGRKLVLDQPATMSEIGRRLRAHLGHARIKVAVPVGATDAPLRVIGVVPGAGGSLLEAAAGEGCEVFITGEMKHHDILAAQMRGVRVILAGHTNTERGYLPRLATRLKQALPQASLRISEADGDPLTVIAD